MDNDFEVIDWGDYIELRDKAGCSIRLKNVDEVTEVIRLLVKAVQDKVHRHELAKLLQPVKD